MSRHWRVFLAVLGAGLIVLALAALIYVWWPLRPLLEQRTVPPELWVPPYTWLAGHPWI